MHLYIIKGILLQIRVVENAIYTNFFDFILTVKTQNNNLDHGQKVKSLTEKKINNRYSESIISQ